MTSRIIIFNPQFIFCVLIVKNRTPTTHLAIKFNIQKLMLLTLSMHLQESYSVKEGYSSRLVRLSFCLSVYHSDIEDY